MSTRRSSPPSGLPESSHARSKKKPRRSPARTSGSAGTSATSRPSPGDGREVAEVPALPEVLAGDRLGFFFDLAWELSGSPDGGEERLVDIARVLRGPDHARDLTAQGAVLLAGLHQDYVPRLGAPAELARDQHRAPLLDEERVGDRVLTPAHQHGREYQEGAPVSEKGTC